MTMKVLSTRLSEESIRELDGAASRLGITKRQFLEEAIHARAVDSLADGEDVWALACGAWKRDETPEETVAAIRRANHKMWQARSQRLFGENS
ncbi:MAG: hypothetical protein HYX53_04135 [Chloroflexi bacterium]|nr:hypothetical protein [Chloroflexota bacterium]